MGFQKVEEHGFVRDSHSHAVSIVDAKEREEYRHKIRTKKELDDLKHRVIHLETCCQNSMIELESIKASCFLLDELKRNLDQLKNQIKEDK